MTVHPIPPGYTSLTPFLCVDGASAAIDFHTGVFGFGNGRLQLGDPADAYGTTAPDARSDVVTRAREAARRFAKHRRTSRPATGSPRCATRSASGGR